MWIQRTAFVIFKCDTLAIARKQAAAIIVSHLELLKPCTQTIFQEGEDKIYRKLCIKTASNILIYNRH